MSTGNRTTRQSYNNSARFIYKETAIPGNPLVTITDTVTPSSVTAVLTDSWSGVDDPDYRRKIRTGENVTNSFTGNRKTYELSPHTFVQETERRQWYGSPPSYKVINTTYRENSTHYLPSDPGPGAHLPEASAVATQQFLRRYRARISEAQALVSAGELGESVRLVLNARRAVFKRLSSFQFLAKKRVFGKRSFDRKKEALADAWLEYSFGWVPLVSDSVNLANAAAKTIHGSMRSLRFGASGNADSAVMEVGTGWLSTGGAGTCSSRLRTVRTTKVSMYGAIKMSSVAPGNFATNFGLTMDNWIPSIWELIPWSFAIDYFTGMGDFINSICTPLNHLQYAGKTSKTKNVREIYDVKNTSTNIGTNINTTIYTHTPGTSRCINYYTTRERVSSLLVPPTLRVPGYKNAYLNLAAIATLRKNNRL